MSAYVKKSLRFDILRLKTEDKLSTTEIAHRLGCSIANVSQTLLHHAQRDFRIAALPPDHYLWLESEARRADVRPAEMARCMLIDAIYEAMEEA